MEDAMAANSGGTDWSAIVKPFVSPSTGKCSVNETIVLCSSIIRSETEILKHKESKAFFDNFVVLAADYISNNAGHLSISQLEIASSASRVLLKYLLAALQVLGKEAATTTNSVLIERNLKAVHSLCVQSGLLTDSDLSSLVNTMKGENIPNSSPSDSDKETSKAESPKSRSDLSLSIFEQLTLPLKDGHKSFDLQNQTSLTQLSESGVGGSGGEASNEINKIFLNINAESLQTLRAGDTLIDLCLNLPSIKNASGKVEECLAGKSLSLPVNHTDATVVRGTLSSTLADVMLVSSALHLPVLEPLSSSKLEKLNNLSMSLLYCGLSQATANAILSVGSAVSPKCTQVQIPSGKEDETDSTAVSLVEEILTLYGFIGNVIKNSTRTGGYMYQNHLLSGAWVLVSGLQAHITNSTSLGSEKSSHLRGESREDKGRSPSKSRDSGSSRSSLLKFQQTFGVLFVALAGQMLSILSELFDDLHLEVCCGNAGSVTQVEPAPLSILGQFTALQRVARVLSAAPLNQLLFYLAIVSYRKASSLKRIHPPEGDSFSQSDSTTYYEDMIMCSDESSTDEDDDSEPILGQWFEETLVPPETAENKPQTTLESSEPKTQSDRVHSIVPEKGEAHGYIILATNIFTFLNSHFLCSKSAYITRYLKNGLTEHQIVILAAIIKDLDRETARTEVGTISVYFGPKLGQFYSNFSGALSRYTHNLVTHSALNSHQAHLLAHLGISPWNTEVPHAWPLQVYPRALAVLAQVLLLRSPNEKEASVMSIWLRLVNTLIENVINPPTVLDTENDDLNVEHAQVLLYLFHALNLMQKKSVVFLMAGGVIRCSEVARGNLKDSQLLHLSRLLLLFDYIMKHLYDAPPSLLEQIQYNLFYSTNLNLNIDREKDKDKEACVARLFTPWPEIEDNYRKGVGNDEFTMKPRFYAISNVEINNQDAPKLDGLACSFILGTADKLRYPLLIDALVEILNVAHVTSGSGLSKISFLGLCSTQYCFSICWKLLQLLPPSNSYMERLSTGESLPAGLLILHTLIWGRRTCHKNFTRWLKDCLVKQGMFTQHTEKLLKSVSDVVNNLKYDVANAKACIVALTPDVKKGVMSKESLPPIWHLFLLHSVLAKVQITAIDEPENNGSSSPSAKEDSTASSSVSSPLSGLAVVQDLLPYVLRLTQAILHCSRWSLLHSMAEHSESADKYSLQDFEAFQEILSFASTKNAVTSSLSSDINALLPTPVTAVLQQWNASTSDECPWTPYLNDIIPSESYVLKIVDSHLSTLSMGFPFSINWSLKKLLQCLVKFICCHGPNTDNTDTKNKVIDLLISLVLDLRTESLYENVSKTLEKMIGDPETDEHQKRVFYHIIENTYNLIINYSSATNNAYNLVNEKILHHCLKFYEKILEKSSGRQALKLFFSGDRDLVKVLMSLSSPQMSQQYGTRVLHFFNKLFQATEKSSTDTSLNYLCSTMSKLASVDGDKLEVFLRHVIIGPTTGNATSTTSMVASGGSFSNLQTSATVVAKTSTTASESNASPSPVEDQKSLIQENSQLLQALTNFIVKQNSNVSEEVTITILKALLPVGSFILSSVEGVGFTDLMVVMTMLADAGSGQGHIHLLPAVMEWLDICGNYLIEAETVKKLGEIDQDEKNPIMLDAAICLLDYLAEVVNGITTNSPNQSGGGSFRALSPPWEGESPLDLETDWIEDNNMPDEEDSGEDSDEDSLCNKLCTFTVTQKEFMNQHWYHCHTCRMLDGVGVCSVCARVCHRGHDLSYAKYGNFFCDCGAKEDGSCQALVKRSPQSAMDGPSGNGNQSSNIGFSEHMLTSSLRRRASSPVIVDKIMTYRDKRKNSLVKNLESSKEWVLNYLSTSSLSDILDSLITKILAAVEVSCARNSSVGCYARGMKALQELHTSDKRFIYTDQLMSPTLGSQEGAFENVRMSYAGEQGQTIRQLLSAHIIRRVAMCCLSSTHGKRQHLAVSHEKGKITVLQLSALLKQADSSTRKLTLTRLASAPIPFTVLSLSSNLCNEDYLAVCGLKDCHILTFNATGAVNEHLVLHPQLETGNFIIKAIWLPGSQTQLALVTADFVKIYDLAKDALSPQYYFLVPSGKIRDCTFMYGDGVYNILLMSSPGHIYIEALNEGSSAKHGTFYVTNTLEVFHLDVTDVNGQVAGGGVSIYYSHILGLLFYSYAQGKSFISPITPYSYCLTVVFPIVLPPTAATTSKSNGNKTPQPQPLCQWMEIPNHPGLICCAMQSSNNPVILMLKPDTIAIQEIKIVPSKSKIMDMVAIRHTSGSEHRTTLILLCEDGSLKIYMANMDQTGYWMSSSIHPTVNASPIKPRKKKVLKAKTPSAVTFPVDFFEHCQLMNDVEIGGSDLLQVYNVAQIKHRLNTTGLYLISAKPLGFSIEITNTNNNMVITGIRVLVGSQDPVRAPSFIEVYGRVLSIAITRSRWYDIPLSRDESLQSDKKLTVGFGPSQDTETVTMIDSIKVYGKTKEAFGWPEESEETPGTSSTNPNGTGSSNQTQNPNLNSSDNEQNSSSLNNMPLTKLEKLVTGILEVLDGTYTLYSGDEKLNSHKSVFIEASTKLLTLPTAPYIQMHSKSLLSSLHSNKQLYHTYKDQALLQHVLNSLTAMMDSENQEVELNAESYYRLVLIVRGIAVARPQNLVKFADSHTSIQDVVIEDPLEAKNKSTKNQHLLFQLMDALWMLHSCNPDNPALAPVVVPGLKHTEQIVHALVEIVHAFNSCDTYSNVTIEVYLQLLLSEDLLIAFSTKQALSRVLKPKCKRRRVYIPSPPHCQSPPPLLNKDESKSSSIHQHQEDQDSSSSNSTNNANINVNSANVNQRQVVVGLGGGSGSGRYDVEVVEPINMLQQAAANIENQLNPLEALLGGGAANFPPLLDIPPDADDETMVELAIALSLQEHELDGDMPQGQQALHLQVLANPALGQGAVAGVQGQEGGHYSDTTASAAGSDDEGSTAATDGSTLRTSPAEQGGSAGSESGGSGVESITGEQNVSGRSSAYGDNIQETINLVSRSDTSSIANVNYQMADTFTMGQEADPEPDSENSSRLHILRLQLLERLIEYLPKLKTIDGVRAIPFLQVVLQLTSDLDGHSERDKACLNSLLAAIIVELQIGKPITENISIRTKQREVQLVLMRLLSVLMSRNKTTNIKPEISQNQAFVSQTTATVLHKADVINYFLKILQLLLDYWRNLDEEETSGSALIGGHLLKEHLPHSPPDMTPFFLKQFVKGHATDVFKTYPQLLTEMALRLPYQVHKHSEIGESISVAFDPSWYRYLCEYMMVSETPFVRRQVRKLLQFICGNKEKYRQMRDIHAFNTHLKNVKQICAKGGYDSTKEVQHSMSLSYDNLVDLVERLKKCQEIASSRTGNWQRFCIYHEDTIPFLLQVSCLLDEGVAPTILQLLHSAVVFNPTSSSNKKQTDVNTANKRKEREKSDDSAVDSSTSANSTAVGTTATTAAAFEDSHSITLVEHINKLVPKEVFARFVKTFMLETNSTSVRWQTHGLIQAIYKNSKSVEQESLLQLLWHLWPLLPNYGRKASQFVDLLGFFSIKFMQNSPNSPQIIDYVDKAVEVLRAQNKLLSHHPNTNLYTQMGQFVELEGYYLEAEPCLVCNNPEVPLSNIKLSTIKVDSKFTTTTQIVKLTSSHTISKITLRIADLKRTKMVRTINIYYNNRNVQAVVELKNKPNWWHKAKKVTLQQGQTEVKIEFPLPIIACNLMVEYSDFYENLQASSETLQCPRCSAAVPANPGVCSNCGENVFQCHKCRAINYDEKDPFLCHSCGFCKYAKFDFTLIARPCCAVEQIENDEDRKKTVQSINCLLDKADRVYKQLMSNKPSLETLLLKISEQRSDGRKVDEAPTQPANSGGAGGTGNSGSGNSIPAGNNQVKVNKTIQMLAQQYCNECKTSFEELSKIIQKVMVSRKELISYDRKQRDVEAPIISTLTNNAQGDSEQGQRSSVICSSNHCYGCSSSATEQCLKLLRALATQANARKLLCSKGLIQELLYNNLRRGTIQIQEEVRQLLCFLTRDNLTATNDLCKLVVDRINLSLDGNIITTDFATGIRHEIGLLASLIQIPDQYWEVRFRCIVKLFLRACKESKSPIVMDSIIMPCLRIWYNLLKPELISSAQAQAQAQAQANANKQAKDKANSASTSSSANAQNSTLTSGNSGGIKQDSNNCLLDIYKWIENEEEHSFASWCKKTAENEKSEASSTSSSSVISSMTREEVRALYLSEKYVRKWKRKNVNYNNAKLSENSWVKSVMFNPSSRLARQVTCNIFEHCCYSFTRRKNFLLLMTKFLDQLSIAGDSAAEFLVLYQNLIQDAPWKQFLTVNGMLTRIADLITKEIDHLHYLEEKTLTTDLTQGYALYHLTELLASFLEDKAIRRQYKGRLVGAVLNGYLSLRRLIVQRTRLIDDTQDKLLVLLEEMTTGTEEETKAFMVICMETVEKYSVNDVLTPVFIFERLCSIIYPEENDIGEFFLTLEKDPQQEDFLQGRMLGNPYSSLEPGLGPLMRDVKNKICQDCELVALLEDDNGMELLVNNKIISLDLPVKEVYKKIWIAEGGEVDSMRVIYRMRGLLGDATEEFIETLEVKKQATLDNEEIYKMANVLAQCGGLQIMVKRLGAVQNIMRARPLVQVLLKLFTLCVKVSQVQEVLAQPEVGAMEVFLRTLHKCLECEHDTHQAAMTEQLLDIMETILSRVTNKSFETFTKFSTTFGGPEYIKSLLTCTTQPCVKNNTSVLGHLTKVLAALVYCNPERMEILMDHFKAVLFFHKYDFEHTNDDQQNLEMFCVLTEGIEKNAIGATLKDYIISMGIVNEALEYITLHAPCIKPTLLRVDSDDMKEFISKPSLKYILRFLSGMANCHVNTQQLFAATETIPIIHRLEQVSSDEHVGTLAENLLEALRTNETVADRIQEARDFTRTEKKRLAMLMREKQLGQMGMRTNEKGQVTAKAAILQQMEELGEETGLVCCICREGYKYQPTKVLGIYTFTKRCNVEDFEAKPRKTVGYNTVTHFNTVHVDCHMNAIRLARARDEWDSAALQNASTKCNGLLPLWGPQVPESAFASCLARHNTYVQECTNHRDIGHMSTIHDLKLLLVRFAHEKTFHEDTGGGGPQSNMHLIPYLIHMALYVINTTRVSKKEETSLSQYLDQMNAEKWIESSYEAEGPLYWLTMSVLLHSHKRWIATRLTHLRRLIIIAQTRQVHPSGPTKTISDKSVKEYSVYKPYLIFYGLVDGIYNILFKAVNCSEELWPGTLADYIRHNDEILLKAAERLMETYSEEILPCTSFPEFCDVAGLLDIIPNPDSYIGDLLQAL